jgi:spermidine synthase
MLKHSKGVLYLLFALSGFCALVYEILWTRYLSLSFGTTIYAVSIVAATFMGGLAIGSFLLGKYADHQTNLLRI